MVNRFSLIYCADPQNLGAIGIDLLNWFDSEYTSKWFQVCEYLVAILSSRDVYDISVIIKWIFDGIIFAT